MEFLLPLAAAASSGRRLALVVGNSSYESVYSLKNAASDANAVAVALEALGFEVTVLNDAGLAEMNTAIDAMASQAEGADATLFYFSGHGFQLHGANYLVPVDAVLDSLDKVGTGTLRLDEIITRLDSAERHTIILLDACRNNPLPESVRGTETANGLAESATGDNSYIVFATAAGGVTSDGAGDVGPFADALVANMLIPDLSISDMMINVRNSVRTATNNVQTPWVGDGLFSKFYFKRGDFDGGVDFEDAGEGFTGGIGVGDEPVPRSNGPIVLPPIQAMNPRAHETIRVADTETPVVRSLVIEQRIIGVDISPFEDVPPGPEPAIELASAIQGQLKRIGCYANTVDGKWGTRSRDALQRYYKKRDIASLGEEPSSEIHRLLVAETGTVCEPIIVRHQPPATDPGPRVTEDDDEPRVTLDPNKIRLGGGIGG